MPSEQIDLVFDFEGEQLRFTDPIVQITAWSIDDVVLAIDQAEQYAMAGCYVAGYVAYEAAPAFDSAMLVHDLIDQPLLWFGIFPAPARSTDQPAANEFHMHDWRCDMSAQEHVDAVSEIKKRIAAGLTYQVNLTSRFTADFVGYANALYESMRRGLGGSYGAYFRIGETCIVSASPELFFRTESGTITTRPMKGTASRGRWLAEDWVAQDGLRNSAKNRAENVMIVDLLRSDLGKIGRLGSVRVPSLLGVERYRTVHQLTSTITAELADATTLASIFRALFPCGSITGAPKISSMGIIRDLERSPRGVYCGAIGFVKPGGAATFNVAIRTAVISRSTNTLTFGSGGGITWDSNAGDEYQEMRNKARVVTEKHPPFSLLETLLVDADGAYTLLRRHVNRLLQSASYFAIPVAERKVYSALNEIRSEQLGTPWRIRLLVSELGDITVERHPLATHVVPIQFALADEPVSSTDVFLFHKTTRRDVYNKHRAAHPDVADVLLWNECQELTEFTFANVALELDGILYTPPIASGLLAGTLRGEMLDTGHLRERTLTADDLRHATRILYINSVRGVLDAVLVEH